MKQNISPGMLAAIEVARRNSKPLQPSLPEEYIILTQLMSMAQTAFSRAELAEYTAQQAKAATRALVEELRVRIQLCEEKHGLAQEEPEAESFDHVYKDDRDEHEDGGVGA